MHEVKILFKALPNDRVLVRNYRRDGITEVGMVLDAEAKVYSNGTGVAKYRVQLYRKSNKGNLLFLYVDNEAIEKA